jgi:hypothetical protein
VYVLDAIMECGLMGTVRMPIWRGFSGQLDATFEEISRTSYLHDPLWLTAKIKPAMGKYIPETKNI